MRTNAPDSARAGDAAFCRNCGRGLKPEAALCVACGHRRDGETLATAVVTEGSAADRGPERLKSATVRGAGGEKDAGAAHSRRAAALALACLLVAACLVAVGLGGLGGLGRFGWGAAPLAPARAVRVLPLFDAAGGRLLLHRDEPGATGPGAAVLVQWPGAGAGAGAGSGSGSPGAPDASSPPRLPELVPAGGGAAIPGVAFADAGPGRVRIDLGPLAAGGAARLLPVRPPDRFFERPAPDDPNRVEATAAYEADGFEGRIRLAVGGEASLASSGRVEASSPGNPTLAATLSWHDGELEAAPGPGVSAGWAGAPGAPGPSGAGAGSGSNVHATSGWLLFVLPPGAASATGDHRLLLDGRTLARLELPEAPEVVVGGGVRPGTILPSPIKRAQGTAAAPPINTNNPLAYFDVLSGAAANARGLTSANQLRQLATGFLLYEQTHGEFPDALEDLSAVLGPVEPLLNNLRTGDNPGFVYEKPRGGGAQEMVWETLGGAKDPTGAVLWSDGSLR